MRLLFFGPPGCGKGTQAQLLRDRQGFTVVGTGEMLRQAIADKTPVGQKVEMYVSQGQLVPDELVNDLVAERFAANPPTKFIMDGYPRTLAQALVLDGILSGLHLPLTQVLLLTVPDDEIVKRLSSRGRADDSPDTVRRRLEIYHTTSKPLIAHYRDAGRLVEIPAIGDVESIYQHIQEQLKK